MKKDVYILSGFLGSGKTTLLKGLLESLKAEGTKPRS
ncbi:GTP-binding protein [Rossellomorea marisflavi]